MNKKTILKKLRKLKKVFDEGNIPIAHKHEINPGLPKSSRENYLYFIMTCSLNFQRISPNTWKSALATWNDRQTNFVFFPEKVVKVSDTKLRRALLKHKLALQPNKHIDIWKRISHTFYNHFNGDPRNLIKCGNNDTAEILKIVQTDMKKGFPYLSGPKLSNYFLFILLAYSNLKMKNIHLISIIPDTHIMKSTAVLGILKDSQINPKNVELAWRELLEGTEFSPIDFHSILWNWSRNKFVPKI